MSSKLGTTEDAIIAALQVALQGKVKTIAWAPPDWDVDFVKRVLLLLPGVFVIFQGGDNESPGGNAIQLGSRWTIVAVAKQVQDPKIGARGAPGQIGCYDILEAVIPALDGLLVKPFGGDDDAVIGTLRFIAWDNSMELQLESQGLSVQSASFSMPLSIDHTLDPSLLVPFETFHAAYNVGQLAGSPPTEDQVALAQ